MIIRIFRCTVIPGMEARHREYAFTASHPGLKEEKGLLAFVAGRPLEGREGRTRCMVQIWESLDALKEARGDDFEEPMKTLPAEAREIYDTATAEVFEVQDNYRFLS